MGQQDTAALGYTQQKVWQNRDLSQTQDSAEEDWPIDRTRMEGGNVRGLGRNVRRLSGKVCHSEFSKLWDMKLIVFAINEN